MKKKAKHRFFNSKLTSAISISIVLFLLGCIIFVGFMSNRLTTYVLENVTLTVFVKENSTEEARLNLEKYLAGQPYTTKEKFIDKETAIRELCEEIGEDPEDYKDINRILDMVEVHMNAQYANNDSIIPIAESIELFDCVDHVDYQEDMVDRIGNNIQKLVSVLICTAAVLLLISYVLISNTIQLLIHSDRFLIHTMTLVGASPSFVRRPYIMESLLIAVVAFVLATCYMLSLGYFLKDDLPPSLDGMTSDPMLYIVVLGSIFIFSIIFTTVATHRAVSKYLRHQVDDLYYI
ncbi:MAG: permease-like cell division protein FtsX [Paludibacteraceae bacterium]|nr:permease-like cell division protein FtsX [Paludibacteraceae bacterium]